MCLNLAADDNPRVSNTTNSCPTFAIQLKGVNKRCWCIKIHTYVAIRTLLDEINVSATINC